MKLTFQGVVKVYLDDINSRCRKSTCEHYRKGMTPFLTEFGEIPLDELSEVYVLALIQDLNKWPDGHPKAGKPKAPDTIRSTVQRWEQLQRFLLKEKYLSEPITKRPIKKPAGRQRRELATIEEIKAILSISKPEFVRMYRSLRMTGARPGELCKSQISDFDQVASVIRLEEHKTSEKTGRPRIIPVAHEALVEIIRESIGDRTEGNIYLMKSGKPWRTEYVSRHFREARDKLGLRKCLVLYLARHEHATALYEATGDVRAPMIALGHANIQTTMRYVHASESKMKKTQQLFDEGF